MTAKDAATSVTPSTKPDADIQALAKGGRTNFLGFLLRLAARLPFLFIAGRLYGADALGRFASALIVIELAAMLCTMGEKRGLAQRLSDSDEPPSHLVHDALSVVLLAGSAVAIILYFLPAPMFPSGVYTDLDLLLVLAIPPLAMTEVLLAAQAYRYDIATSVRARAIVEPWTISIMAGAMYFIVPESGLAMAYLISIYAAFATAAWPFFRSYGAPRGWRPSAKRMTMLSVRGMPLAAADAIEWGTRRLDIFILGLFVSPAVVGIYYVAQQVASLPQKLKTSFEPILGPVITRKLKERDYKAIAKQVCQVGFWIMAAQAGVGLALGIPGEAIMGLVGPNFVSGTGALAFLLTAEVLAATAVVAEAALVYMARLRNLWVSVFTIMLQGALTVSVLLLADQLGWSDHNKAAAAAGALMIALGASSFIKATMLSRMLKEPVNNWRWPLLWAIVAAVAVGQAIILLPEWAELLFGIPIILGVYGWIIWTKGFGSEDRVLFRRKIASEEEEEEAAAPPASETRLPQPPAAPHN